MTKGKLLALFTFSVIIEITVAVMCRNHLVTPYEVSVLILCTISIPPMFFMFHFEMKKCFSLKNVSSCLLVVACQIDHTHNDVI